MKHLMRHFLKFDGIEAKGESRVQRKAEQITVFHVSRQAPTKVSYVFNRFYELLQAITKLG
ncbi:hypothetical protein Bca52824_082866 [Brassica carinata]|uniref:Uncharacterized protein n=1 Tax=Brassica carinata TaxID=52824 RepID=A0A8X7PKB7_BRACI|nr:hypothetical protein Bca52824_082866 [Brassica carinata]